MILKSALLTIFTTLIITATQISFADQHHGQSSAFTSTPLTDNISLLQGKGGNIAVLEGEQGLVMIDSEYKDMSDALIAELAKHGGAEKLSYLINTHWHGDHTQGNDALGHYAQIIAHENVRTRLLTTQEIKQFNMVSEPYPSHALPSVTFDNSLSLHINGEHLEIIHFANGHTDGDSVVFFKNANIVHMGDHFFSGFFPFVDVGHGGDVVKMATNIHTVLSMINDDTQVIPGHGPLSSKADLQAFYDMLVGTTAEVAAMREDDMWLEEMQDKGLSEQWKEWADGMLPIAVWIEVVNDSLDNPK